MTGTAQSRHGAVRPDWLAISHEAALDPDRIIVDAHHHLFDRPGQRYLLDDMLADIATGHNVRATVHVQARSMYRSSGPEEMRPVGETEFTNGMAAMCDSGRYDSTRSLAVAPTRPQACSAVQVRLSWVSITALGRPVVPEV